MRNPWWLKNSATFLPKFFGQSTGPAFVSYSKDKIQADSIVADQKLKNQLTRLATADLPKEAKSALHIAVVEPEPIAKIEPKPAPKPEPKPEPTPPLIPKAAEKAQLDLKQLAVYFNTSSSYVKPTEAPKIQKVAELIKKAGLTETKLTVGGYADLRGNADFNRKLSLERANAVRAKLIKLGVPAKQLTVEFFGEDTSEVAPDDLWKSRRVEISFNKP